MDEAFHAFRKTGIGGSDSAPALGLSPWKSPLALYMEKIGEAPPIPDNDPMLFGRLLEPIVLAEFSRRTGLQLVDNREALRQRSTVHPFMLANLDGLTYVGDKPVVIEAKTARTDRGFGEAGSDDVPHSYILQATHNMIVAGAELCYIPVLIAGSDFRIYEVRRQPELVDLVIEGESQFWQAVESREPPSPRTLQEINQRWKDARSGIIELPEGVARAIYQLAETRNAIKLFEGKAEEMEGEIKKAMQFFDVATVDGVVVATWKQAKPSKVFDAKAFREAHPALAAEFEYEKPGSRRFLLKQ